MYIVVQIFNRFQFDKNVAQCTETIFFVKFSTVWFWELCGNSTRQLLCSVLLERSGIPCSQRWCVCPDPETKDFYTWGEIYTMAI